MDVARCWRLLPLLLLGACLVSVGVSPRRISHDPAMYLQCAELMLDGQVPYVDFVDLNPPLVIYLSAVPVLLGRVLGADAVLLAHLLAVALAAWAAWSVRARILAVAPAAEAWAALTAAALLLFAAWAWQSGDLLQRDALVGLLLAPWVAARWLVWRGSALPRWRGFGIGLGAAAAVCLKPHYAALAGAVEVYFVAAQRRWPPLGRGDTTGLAVGVLAYAVHFALVPAAMRDALLSRWLPLVAAGYAAYDAPLERVASPRGLILALLCGVVLALRRVWWGPLPELAGAWSVAGLAAFAAVLVQHKGWAYHMVPLLAFAALSLATTAAAALDVVRRQLATRWLHDTEAIGLGLAAAAAVGILWAIGPLFPAPGPWPSRLAPWVEQYTEPGEAVAVLSTSVNSAYPLLYDMRRRPGTRYLWLFPLPMALHLHARPPGEKGPRPISDQERRVFADLRLDLAQRRPPLILVNDTGPCQACPWGFNLQRYLARNRATEVLREYERVGEVDGYLVFVARERAAVTRPPRNAGAPARRAGRSPGR